MEAGLRGRLGSAVPRRGAVIETPRARGAELEFLQPPLRAVAGPEEALALHQRGKMQQLTAFTGARILPIAGDPIPEGVLVVQGGRTPTGRDAIAWAREAAERGAGELLVTSMDTDGHQDGYDLALLRAIREAVQVPIIASGGVSSLADLKAIKEKEESGIAGVIWLVA